MKSADDITGLELRDFMPESVCAACGSCCKTYPGQFFPQDLGDNHEQRKAKARALIETGNYVIDDWQGDPRKPKRNKDGMWVGRHDERVSVPFLRPAMRGKEGRIYHGGYGGVCVFLGEDGCTLEREERPRVCKALAPTPGGLGCSGISKQQVALAWLDEHWLYDLHQEMEAERDEKDNDNPVVEFLDAIMSGNMGFMR